MSAIAVDTLPELLEKISLNTYDPGNSYWVNITHINNPHSFYVRPTAYRQFMSTVEAQGDPIDPAEVKRQTTVVFQSAVLNKFIRGLIFSIEKTDITTTCDIFASDYGFIEKSVEVKNMFKPKTCIPPLAVHCQLADCKPIGGSAWTEREVDAMKCYVGQERAKMFVREKSFECLKVVLINSLPDDIATMLALTGYSTMGYGENSISRVTTLECEKLYFTYKKLKPNDILKVRLQSGKDLKAFYVAEKNDYEKFLNERENYTYFTKKLKKLSVDDLEVDKPVGVFMDSSYKYERGIIREVLSDSRARIQLVDWGYIIETHVSSLKPMSEKFFYYDASALYCSVDKDQLNEPGLQKYMYPGYQFVIEIKEVGKGFNNPNIVRILPYSHSLKI